MVIMALATTFLTTPLVAWLLPSPASARGRAGVIATPAH